MAADIARRKYRRQKRGSVMHRSRYVPVEHTSISSSYTDIQTHLHLHKHIILTTIFPLNWSCSAGTNHSKTSALGNCLQKFSPT